MLKLAIKTLIILLTISNMHTVINDNITLIFLLLAITTTALNQYYNTTKLTFTLLISYSLISLFHPFAFMFLPVLFFDGAIHLKPKHTFFFPLIFLTTPNEHTFFHILMGFLALILSHMFTNLVNSDIANKKIRDTNSSQKKSLIMKNQELINLRTDEINMAKLKERNRIARDIHDTVGHYLSRALLQTGALSAINKNESMQQSIDELKETLNNSMNSIRNGVHDLKDDSINLERTISNILDESGFKNSFTYDVLDDVPNVIKNYFLAILKESITNTRKHSDATEFLVRIIEHPAMYQFLVADNGTKEPKFTGRGGIGLQNIHERINELSGYCRINYQNGFRIFITIPR